MTTPLDLADRPSSHRSVPVDAELDLTALLELFAPDELAPETPRRSLRSSGARLRGWALRSSLRAAGRGVVPASADVHQYLVVNEAAK